MMWSGQSATARLYQVRTRAIPKTYSSNAPCPITIPAAALAVCCSIALPVGVGGAASVASSRLGLATEATEEGLVSSSVRTEVGRGIDAEPVNAEGCLELMGADEGRAEGACGFGVCTGAGTLVTPRAL